MASDSVSETTRWFVARPDWEPALQAGVEWFASQLAGDPWRTLPERVAHLPGTVEAYTRMYDAGLLRKPETLTSGQLLRFRQDLLRLARAALEDEQRTAVCGLYHHTFDLASDYGPDVHGATRDAMPPLLAAALLADIDAIQLRFPWKTRVAFDCVVEPGHGAQGDPHPLRPRTVVYRDAWRSASNRRGARVLYPAPAPEWALVGLD